MTRRGIADLVRAARQQRVISLFGWGVTVLLTIFGQASELLTYALIALIIAAVGAWVWNYVTFRRQAKLALAVEHPTALSADQGLRIQTVVSAFDMLKVPGGPQRTSPVITLLQHLPTVGRVRLVMSPDIAGQPTADQRAEELRSWLATGLPGRSIDLKVLDARLPAEAFDDEASTSLGHALESLRHLPGLVIDITAGTKPMSITLQRAAETANLPVTYLLQPTPGQQATAFHGLTLLADPEGAFEASGGVGDA